jgi:hypothetical protein
VEVVNACCPKDAAMLETCNNRLKCPRTLGNVASIIAWGEGSGAFPGAGAGLADALGRLATGFLVGSLTGLAV